MGDYSPKFKPGQDVTLTAGADITGGQLLYVSGVNTVAPTTASTASWFGVARQDTKSGDKVVVCRGGVQKPVASGAITAGDRVIPGAAGTVVSSTAANSVGTALTTAANGATVLVAMDR